MAIPVDQWQSQVQTIATRFDREFRGESFSLPPEVESMPIFQDWAAHKLQAKLASPFWELLKPQKNQRCLDLGCGLSFLIYPCWRTWDVYFYGHDISTVAKDLLNSRAPQLNSKLFKGVVHGAAHYLRHYEPAQFDFAIATGFSCYYSLDYWEQVLLEVKRVLKPSSGSSALSSGGFVFDVLNPETELAENWAILETYLGAEVFLEPIAQWEALIKKVGGKIQKKQPGELFDLYKVSFS